MGDEHWHGQSEALLQSHRKRPVVSAAAIIAVAASTDGKRVIVGLHIGPSEAETLWTGFLKSLHRRGLKGVRLVISGAHEGLKAAIRRILNASWQHCCQSARERDPLSASKRDPVRCDLFVTDASEPPGVSLVFCSTLRDG